ncbi:serine/arginine-rich splicing factor 10-like [Panonychus citri]|uniref:serine/arginine-rich splicing factor 10-like n=1 Tax=Panonychus citri TaxID=50023 RepID=UPI0023070F0A|nr:serine/arginine-rich splicing factor 10-like [Panonychus citri]
MPRSGSDRIANKSLFIKNLSEDIRSTDLKNIFGKYGKIADVYIPVDYYNRKPRGFAYVQYESLRDAKDAVRDLQHLTFHGRELAVEFAQGDRKTPGEMRYKERRTPNERGDSRHNGHKRRSSRERYRSRSRSRSRDRDRSRYRSRERSRQRSRERSRERW